MTRRISYIVFSMKTLKFTVVFLVGFSLVFISPSRIRAYTQEEYMACIAKHSGVSIEQQKQAAAGTFQFTEEQKKSIMEAEQKCQSELFASQPSQLTQLTPTTQPVPTYSSPLPTMMPAAMPMMAEMEQKIRSCVEDKTKTGFPVEEGRRICQQEMMKMMPGGMSLTPGSGFERMQEEMIKRQEEWRKKQEERQEEWMKQQMERQAGQMKRYMLGPIQTNLKAFNNMLNRFEQKATDNPEAQTLITNIRTDLAKVQQQIETLQNLTGEQLMTTMSEIGMTMSRIMEAFGDLRSMLEKDKLVAMAKKEHSLVNKRVIPKIKRIISRLEKSGEDEDAAELKDLLEDLTTAAADLGTVLASGDRNKIAEAAEEFKDALEETNEAVWRITGKPLITSGTYFVGKGGFYEPFDMGPWRMFMGGFEQGGSMSPMQPGMMPSGMSTGGMSPGRQMMGPGGQQPGGGQMMGPMPGGMSTGGMGPGMPMPGPGMPMMGPGGQQPGGGQMMGPMPGGMSTGGMGPGMPMPGPGMPMMGPGGQPGGMFQFLQQILDKLTPQMKANVRDAILKHFNVTQ